VALVLSVAATFYFRSPAPAPALAGQVQTEGREWQYVCGGKGASEILTDSVTGRRYIVVISNNGPPCVLEVLSKNLQAEAKP
jgi:hypothetical protein